MMRMVMFLLSALIFLFLGMPCLFFGLLGVRGQLADVSDAENLSMGLVFLGFGLLAATPGILCAYFWLRPGLPTDQKTEQAADCDNLNAAGSGAAADRRRNLGSGG